MDKIIDANSISPESIKVEVDGEIIAIDVLPYLTLKDRGQFVVDVADSVFIDGTYAPYMLNFAYNFFLLQHYTNMTMPKDAEKVNQLIQTTDIVDRVDEIIYDKYLYFDILDLIEYRKNEYLKHSKTDEFVESITSLVKSLDTMANSDEFKDKNLNEIIDTAKQIAGKDESKITSAVLDFEAAKNAKKSV